MRRDCLGDSSIDAMGRGGGHPRSRSNRMRAQRWLEGPWRHLWGVMDLGLVPWVALECVNAVARLMPKLRRQRLLRWAETRL